MTGPVVQSVVFVVSLKSVSKHALCCLARKLGSVTIAFILFQNARIKKTFATLIHTQVGLPKAYGVTCGGKTFDLEVQHCKPMILNDVTIQPVWGQNDILSRDTQSKENKR